jgi:hypothetical protein
MNDDARNREREDLVLHYCHKCDQYNRSHLYTVGGSNFIENRYGFVVTNKGKAIPLQALSVPQG